MVNAVKNTGVIASVATGWMGVLNLCQEVLKAVSYSNAGKKIRRIIS